MPCKGGFYFKLFVASTCFVFIKLYLGFTPTVHASERVAHSNKDHSYIGYNSNKIFNKNFREYGDYKKMKLSRENSPQQSSTVLFEVEYDKQELKLKVDETLTELLNSEEVFHDEVSNLRKIYKDKGFDLKILNESIENDAFFHILQEIIPNLVTNESFGDLSQEEAIHDFLEDFGIKSGKIDDFFLNLNTLIDFVQSYQFRTSLKIMLHFIENKNDLKFNDITDSGFYPRVQDLIYRIENDPSVLLISHCSREEIKRLAGEIASSTALTGLATGLITLLSGGTGTAAMVAASVAMVANLQIRLNECNHKEEEE